MMALLSALIRYIVDASGLRALLRAWFFHPYPTMGRALLGAQGASERVYVVGKRAGHVFRERVREGLSKGSEKPCKGLGGSAGTGMPQKGSTASAGLSGGSMGVCPGEGMGADRLQAESKGFRLKSRGKEVLRKMSQGIDMTRMVMIEYGFFRKRTFRIYTLCPKYYDL